MNKAISIKSLDFAYDKEKILEGLDLDIGLCDFVAIVGANGEGKSTLINLLLSNLRKDRGTVRIFGDLIEENNHFSDIAYISQDAVRAYKTFPTTIEEAVKIHTSFLKVNKDVDKLLDEVGLKGHKDKALSELSGGQLQRLGLLLALIKDARLILLDEPTTGIDKTFSKELFVLLKKMTQNDKTVVIVTHDLRQASFYVDYAFKICDKKAILIDKSRLEDVLE